jgi:two-component system sensor histidine kinase ChiS
MVAAAMLQAEKDFDILEASDGFEALRILEKRIVDAVLLDIMMPGMSGYDVCKKIREQKSRLDLPVLMVSALSQSNDIVEGFYCGANDYIVKPVIREELSARLRAQLKARDEARKSA